jgi:DNA repair protein RecN (Recombination protein N)
MKSAEVTSGTGELSLMVFDEVDAGIGGRTANEVANKLKKLSTKGQLIVVTHLHQIARVADHHYVAEKQTDRAGRTVISVNRLSSDALQPELDRMIALPEEA